MKNQIQVGMNPAERHVQNFAIRFRFLAFVAFRSEGQALRGFAVTPHVTG
ncbi:hypothetical protein V5R04_03045 [Jonesiaceae bacterium BS-20]|uniref:Uncharacterized protein n=1 Tax=Jonesiaceae bacterium BS-20 TaxID=3120821 RepID=A0AAU7DVL5_9MICO